jgi:hypothetical protein
VRIFDRIREYLRRHNDLSAGRDPVWDEVAGQAPTQTMPAASYEPHGIDSRETLAGIIAKAQADALAAQESAQTEQWGEWDEPAGPAPLVAAHEPPPMPPSDLSRIMVAQIPAPPANDRNFEWTHKYADYMRRVGVATGTSTDLEHTMAWGMPALKPGDGTGVRLAAQEQGETGPEVAA